MDPVRTPSWRLRVHFHGAVVPAERRSPEDPDGDIPVLDLICVVGVIALGAIVALVGRGVEKL